MGKYIALSTCQKSSSGPVVRVEQIFTYYPAVVAGTPPMSPMEFNDTLQSLQSLKLGRKQGRSLLGTPKNLSKSSVFRSVCAHYSVIT